MQRLTRTQLRRVGGIVAAIALVVLVVTDTLSAETQYPHWNNDTLDKRPYIFTQQNNVEGREGAPPHTQKVRIGYPLQVQLPGNPAVWTFDAGVSTLVEPRGWTMVFSPDRIPGTQSIFVFDFVLSPDAAHGDEGVIVLTTSDLPEALDMVLPQGVFAVKFQVIDPK
ncbi:hypothetical protein [uncultured Tateyamaria sp.]|uniref:hypothetical protein n=1 Tax=Tateyamaria sp. 1078 TaxID=3417464 RepID=UPI00263252A9|nr:hypothetical protein [uncultured Tateyamaria sp.]